MHRKHTGQRAVQFILGGILCLFILSAAVVATLNFRALYYADIHYLNIPELSGLDEQVIRENYDAVIAYNGLFNRAPLEFPSLAMSETGRIHFEEVKAVFALFGWTALVTALLSAAGMVWAGRRKAYTYLKVAGILSLVLPAALGILVAVNWEFAFTAFHKVVFRNDYWIFDSVSDPVITILPDTFFLHCAILIFGLVLLGSALCLILHRVLTRRQKA